MLKHHEVGLETVVHSVRAFTLSTHAWPKTIGNDELTREILMELIDHLCEFANCRWYQLDG